MKEKEQEGAEHFMSQLFFDNEDFYAFREKTQIAGIKSPIEAGIMPVTSKSGVLRMVSMCGASVPKKLARILNRYEDNEQAFHDACIAYAIDQIADLITNEVDGIHLYTMNKPDVAHRIYAAVKNLL
jgi:methylenetetrahydrofolate reductase (NADPH)